MIPPTNSATERAIVEAANGSEQAFHVIWEWCSSDLKRYCRSLLRRADLRIHYEEDLLSDVMRRFSIELKRHCNNGLLDCECAWGMLLRSAQTLAIDHHRHTCSQKRRPPGPMVPIECALHVASKEPNERHQLELDELWCQFVSTLTIPEHRLLDYLLAGEDIDSIALNEACVTRTIVRRIQRLAQRWIDLHSE